jgi:purine nucleosidase/pyrimidine-specific ribonucleoside hydrolase
MRFFAQTYNDVFEMPDPPLHDPIAVAVLIDASITKNRFVNVEVELNGEHTRGATVVDIYARTGGKANVSVALELDFDKFWNVMLDAVEAAGR